MNLTLLLKAHMTVFEIVVNRNVDNWIQLLNDVSSRSVKTVLIHIFAKSCMLHKFAITNTIFFC